LDQRTVEKKASRVYCISIIHSKLYIKTPLCGVFMYNKENRKLLKEGREDVLPPHLMVRCTYFRKTLNRRGKWEGWYPLNMELRTKIHAEEVARMLEYWIKEPALQKHEEHCEWLEDTIYHVKDPMTDVTSKLQLPPDYLFYMIYVDNKHVGFVEAFSRPFDFHGLSIDITSICIFKEFRGNGYVREALKMLISQLFDTFSNARHISCQTSQDNKPMVKHLQELGFVVKETTKIGEIFLFEREKKMHGE